MKKILYIAIFFIMVSCAKVLDIDPLDEFSETTIWNDENLVECFVNNVYLAVDAYKTGGYGPCSATDQVYEQFWYWTCSNYLVQGTLTPEKAYRIGSYMWWKDGDGGRWQRFYAFIRETNVFFSKIDEVEGDEDFINRMKGEMYFLRAYSYCQLIDYYGGVPIVEDVYDVNSTDYDAARDTYQDCIDYIVKQLDEAISLLPDSYTGIDVGRATKGAAMAMKARELLYAASPLYNGATFNADYQDGQWNTVRLNEAKIATKAVLDLPQYTLYEPENYNRIFCDKNNSEVIFARYFSGDVTIEHENRYAREMGPNSIGGWSAYNPLQQFVDQFQMADGSEFDWNNPTEAADPYANREKRFYADIYYDGATYKYGSNEMTLQMYVGGLDSPESSLYAWNASETGYLCKKHQDDTEDWYTDDTQNDMWIIYRLSEFYLNYAEILCELNKTGDALDWVNPIRVRAGLPKITTTNQDELREKIHHERNIELCFEGQHYQDVRRWGIYKDVLSEDGLGISITKAEDGTKTYKTKITQVRTYDPKVWFMSLTRDELQKDLNLENNPGYD